MKKNVSQIVKGWGLSSLLVLLMSCSAPFPDNTLDPIHRSNAHFRLGGELGFAIVSGIFAGKEEIYLRSATNAGFLARVSYGGVLGKSIPYESHARDSGARVVVPFEGLSNRVFVESNFVIQYFDSNLNSTGNQPTGGVSRFDFDASGPGTGIFWSSYGAVQQISGWTYNDGGFLSDMVGIGLDQARTHVFHVQNGTAMVNGLPYLSFGVLSVQSGLPAMASYTNWDPTQIRGVSMMAYGGYRMVQIYADSVYLLAVPLADPAPFQFVRFKFPEQFEPVHLTPEITESIYGYDISENGRMVVILKNRLVWYEATGR